MIDLHTHTNYSDGTWSVKKLLEEAEKSNIEVLSITDHDNLGAYKELEEIDHKKIFKGQIITGVELNTVYNGVAFHLLAYDFDYNKLYDWVQKNYRSKKTDLRAEFDYMLQSCKNSNIKIDDIKYDESKRWPVDMIFPEIKKYEENKKYFKEEEWNNIDVFFDSCMTNKNFPAYVDFSIHFPTADVVAEEVRKANGKLFVAHPYRYKLEDTIHFLDVLKNNKIIDGVEVYHSIHTNEQISILEKYCKDNNLLVSGGSDCHGEKKAERKIGVGYGNLNIRKEMINFL